jgi:hypothetical protein
MSWRPKDWPEIKQRAFRTGEIRLNVQLPGLEFEAGADALFDALKSDEFTQKGIIHDGIKHKKLTGIFVFIPDDIKKG